RDARRELRLEYVQIRELTRYLMQEIAEGIRPNTLLGFVENLDRRLHAHEKEMGQVYYPAAASLLTADEWQILEQARPEEQLASWPDGVDIIDIWRKTWRSSAAFSLAVPLVLTT